MSDTYVFLMSGAVILMHLKIKLIMYISVFLSEHSHPHWLLRGNHPSSSKLEKNVSITTHCCLAKLYRLC